MTTLQFDCYQDSRKKSCRICKTPTMYKSIGTLKRCSLADGSCTKVTKTNLNLSTQLEKKSCIFRLFRKQKNTKPLLPICSCATSISCTGLRQYSCSGISTTQWNGAFMQFFKPVDHVSRKQISTSTKK